MDKFYNTQKEFLEIFPKNTLIEASRSLYSCYVNYYYDFDDTFERLFSVPYKLVFKSLSKEEFLMNLLKLYYRNELFVKRKFEADYELSSIGYIEELPVLNSRIDIAAVDGFSYAYEIKTKYDTLARLEKQVQEYARCFEMVVVVCSEDKAKEVLNIVPTYCGVFSYKDRANCSFKEIRKAKCSKDINTLDQLSFMYQRELRKTFNTNEIDKIASSTDPEVVNEAFKNSLKHRILKKST